MVKTMYHTQNMKPGPYDYTGFVWLLYRNEFQGLEIKQPYFYDKQED